MDELAMDGDFEIEDEEPKYFGCSRLVETVKSLDYHLTDN